MAGGRIQGNRRKENDISADEIIERAKSAVGTNGSKRRPISSNGDSSTITNYGDPSTEHERPTNQPGERDPAGIAPGRRSPFSQHRE